MHPVWQAPWYVPYRPLLETVGEHALAGRWQRCIDGLNQAAAARGLRNANGRPLRFGPAGAAGTAAYEAHIWATGEVPTRTGDGGGWHDLFNALVWLRFPATKAQLNRLQAAVIAVDGIGARRGRVRDAATLFDESGVLLVTDAAEIPAALHAFDWPALFVGGRQRFVERARVLVFGHALLDKLRAPYKAACGHAWLVEAPAWPGPDTTPEASLVEVDACVAAALAGGHLHPDAFSPLPVLGVPGWCDANRAPAFYDDPRVFRAGRRYNGRRSGSDGRWRGNPPEEGPDSIGQGAGQRPGATSRKTQGDGKWHREQTADGGT